MPKTKKIGNRVFDGTCGKHATLELQANNPSMLKQVQPECQDRCPETFISDLLIRFDGLADPSRCSFREGALGAQNKPG